MTETSATLRLEDPLALAKPTPWIVKALGRLMHHRSAMVGLVLVVAYVFIAVGADFVAPFPPAEQHPVDMLQAPSARYWLGTDEFGRDILSRLIHGARNSFRVAFLAVGLAGLAGTTLGMTAAYVGGFSDNLIMRVMDLLFAFPSMLLALAVVAALGPGAGNTILAIGIVYTPIFARVSRGPVLVIKNIEFVDAARAVGSKHVRILARHILPNIMAPILVQITLALSWAMLTEAGLSFLGLGTIPPAPSWGSMLSESRLLMELAPWTAIYPGVALMLGVLGFNLLGDGLRDALDPRLRM